MNHIPKELKKIILEYLHDDDCDECTDILLYILECDLFEFNYADKNNFAYDHFTKQHFNTTMKHYDKIVFLYNVDKTVLNDLKGCIHLKSLSFNNDFNKMIKSKIIPKNITKNSLPDNLTHLTFGKNFDQPLGGKCFPKTLTYLKFGEAFNYSIAPNILPVGLTHLIFGDDYNQLILKNTLPISLTHLVFGKKNLINRLHKMYFQKI